MSSMNSGILSRLGSTRSVRRRAMSARDIRSGGRWGIGRFLEMSGGVHPITYRAQSTLVTQRKQFAAIALVRSARVASTAPFNTAGIAVDVATRYGNDGPHALPLHDTTPVQMKSER